MFQFVYSASPFISKPPKKKTPIDPDKSCEDTFLSL